ncbi:Glutathione-regulated potassium-efflux system protein KefB [Candidatus Burkholderia pumila]|uniref:Glutathione-regulated potassium-efflux system protein KefB n=1 Tax=Candidatus Burkholderia pumila TaxID=1090375 RepID=A0ABR5HN64_9BURK|nr:Glutathione-regulated potassium-efflux system protein KefB [Candidatus Burkholderia pumila]
MISPLEMTLLLLLCSVVGVVVFRYFNLPPMLGYLTVGIIVGPHAAGIAPDTDRAQHLAEFGVVFLMFSIGLEFSLSKLRSMWRIVFGLGASQVGTTIALTMIFGWIAHFFMPMSWQASFALGGAISMSSTVIVSKLLVERLELESEHGRNIFGVLLFQDLAVVPLLIIIAAFGNGNSSQLAMWLGIAAIKIVVALTVLLFIGQKFMSRWFDLVARRRSQELFMLNLLLVTLGAAFITDKFDLSLALGAFIAGMLIAETPYRHQVEEDIKPFRDVLLGLFFVTTGMLLNPRVIWEHPFLVLSFFVVPILLKAVMITALARAFSSPQGVAMRTGLNLAQAGEFGFVLMNLILDSHLVDSTILQAILAAMLLSMLAAPFIIQNADRIVLRLSSTEWMLQSLQMTKIATQSLKQSGHVIICGYGRSGQNLARMLEHEGLSYVALDLDPDRVAAAAAGESVVFGDAGRRESLLAAGLHRAATVAITYANTPSAMRVLHNIHELQPTLPVIVRTVDDADLEKLTAAGATEVIPEIVEGSLMLASHTLVLMGVPMRRVVRRVEEMRAERYSLLRGYFHGRDDNDDDDGHEQVRLQSVPIDEKSEAVGRSLDDLGLVGKDVEVTAIRRHGIRGIKPGPETKLRANDIVVLCGLPEVLAQAEERLSRYRRAA